MRVRQPGSADINLDEIDTRLNQLWNFDHKSYKLFKTERLPSKGIGEFSLGSAR